MLILILLSLCHFAFGQYYGDPLLGQALAGGAGYGALDMGAYGKTRLMIRHTNDLQFRSNLLFKRLLLRKWCDILSISIKLIK